LPRRLPAAYVREQVLGIVGGCRLRRDPDLGRVRSDHVVAPAAPASLGRRGRGRRPSLISSVGVDALKTSTYFVCRNGLWLHWLAAVTSALSAPAPAESGIPTVDPFFMLSGALLKDDFDGPQLDTNLWSRPGWLVENHRTIAVKIENGHLAISGASHPAARNH